LVQSPWVSGMAASFPFYDLEDIDVRVSALTQYEASPSQMRSE
jgi:hypothetical protein